MEKAFDLKPAELQTFNALEQDNLRANATYGVLARQMDETKQKIAQSEEAQRQFIRQALRDRGVEQFPSARLEPGKIIVTLPDETPMQVAPPPVKAISEQRKPDHKGADA